MAGLYRIQTILGHGAHATVCVAVRRADGQPVALKVLRSDLVNDVHLLARMRDEAQLLSVVVHPDVVHVHALHDFGGRPVLEMDYVDGRSLEKVVRESGVPVPIVEALEIGRRMALALDAVYRHPGKKGEPLRIIHRDVKPENVLISRDGHLKLVDFGIAKAEFHGRTAKTLGLVLGSAGFDAPERRLGIDSPATDVYALGVTLFVLATGKTLVINDARRDEDIARQVSRLGGDLADPDRVRKLVTAMLQARPADRPSAADTAAEISAILAAEGKNPDLARWVHGLQWGANDSAIAANEHPDWPHISFLETDRPTPPIALTRSQARVELRRLMSQAGWHRRLPEVERVLCGCQERVEGPLVDVLRRYRVPWWRFWARAATTEELEAALWVLADRPSNDVIGAAQALVDHPTSAVSRSARMVLERSRAG
jgi:serine/threonine protein kinase